MDRNKKFLKSLSPLEFKIISEVMLLLYTNNIATLDIKKLKGFKALYRVRVGNMRIIFTKEKATGQLIINEIARRTDNTYKNY
jgi:mRNA-degrading endonuclease RelE of RelBE toxin-antitoxin system